MNTGLAGQLLPVFQFSERHALDVQAAPGRILDAIEQTSDEDDPLVRLFLQVREAPARLALRLGLRNGLAERPRFGLHAFTPLGRADDREIAFGLIGRFWRSDFGLRPCTNGDEFRTFHEPGTAKLLLHFRCEEGTHGARLHTETRVYCPDRRSRLLFTPYWLAIRPVSGLIRQRLLRDIRRRTLDA